MFRREPRTEVQYNPVVRTQPSVTPSTHNMISRSEGSRPTSEESNPPQWKRSGAIRFPKYKLEQMVHDLHRVQADRVGLGPMINATPSEEYGEYAQGQRIARQDESENTARVIDGYYAPNYGGKMKRLPRTPQKPHWFYG